VFAGVVVAATGGPLYLSGSVVPSLLGEAAPSAGLVAILGAAMFAPTLLIWLRYSEDIVSAGGLFGFVEAAVGRKVALAQAGLWLVSYGLYLSYTVAYISYDLLPAAFPGVLPYRAALQLAIPVALAALALAPIRWSMTTLAIVAGGQVILVAVLIWVSIAHFGAPAGAFVGHGQPQAVAVTGANTGLLFICASLPLFLAGEVRGGSAAVRSGLAAGVALVAGLAVLAAFPLSASAPGLLDGEAAGVTIADSAGASWLTGSLGVGLAVSVAAVMAGELLAVTRLVHDVTKVSVARISRVVALGLVAASAASLVDAQHVYDALLRPSLVALWLAQLVVVAAYPRFAVKKRPLRAGDWLLTGAGAALMVYGLYSAAIGSVAT
jgi:amino acid transporter